MTTTTKKLLQTLAGVIATDSINVATTATLLVSASITRIRLAFFNNSDTTIFVGPSGVTTAGYPILTDTYFIMDEEDAVVAWYGIHGGAGTKNLRVLTLTG